jgi:8-oxo-dGTP pyrophosphatase MutT (NUDIX family)
MPRLVEIRRSLVEHRPTTVDDAGRRRAAVAVVVRERRGAPELLFIERARHESDPWSGHMAFPGGRVEAGDAHPREAAERETLEEVGLPLADAEHLGRLDDMQGHHAAGASGLVISAFVYHAPDPPPLATNHEVRDAFWVPLPFLIDPERRVALPFDRGDGLRYPGILVGEPERHVIWGLTYRFLECFFEVVGRPLPDRWREDAGEPVIQEFSIRSR